MSFRQEFISDLPADPRKAIVVLGDRAQDWLNSPGSPNDKVNLIYITEILQRFIERYQIDVRMDPSSDPDGRNLSDYLEAIARYSAKQSVDDIIDDYENSAGNAIIGIAILNIEEKGCIHDHIASIRSIINESDLDIRKKNALFDRLNGLSVEVDKYGTRTDAFFAFAGDAAFLLGDLAEKARPFIKEIKDIVRIVTKSRARTEGVSLPSGEEALRLPSPDKED